MAIPIFPPKKRFIIGIDPGVDTGLAVYDREQKKLIYCVTVDFWATYLYILQTYPTDYCKIFIEDCSLRNYTFNKKGSTEYQERLSRNVGGVMRESALIVKGLKLQGYEVVNFKPSGEKWTQEEFQRYTHWGKKVSEHARDAARFCYGI